MRALVRGPSPRPADEVVRAGRPRRRERLGRSPAGVDVSESWRLGGCLTCLTCLTCLPCDRDVPVS